MIFLYSFQYLAFFYFVSLHSRRILRMMINFSFDPFQTSSLSDYPIPVGFSPPTIALPMRLDSTVPVCPTITAPSNTRLTSDSSKTRGGGRG